MRYQVPQFIEIEDKIIGPFTIQQFLYLAGGAGMAFLVYHYIYFYLALPLVAGIVALAAALAFYRPNNKPFIDLMESAFLYYTKGNLYIWKKEEKIIKQQVASSKVEEPRQVYVPRLSDSKLRDLSWTLDINENLNPLTGEDGKNTK